jgi:hypothetical protein
MAPSSRRRFLAKLGLSAAVAPFVPMLDRFARAASTGAFPARLLLTFAPNGTREHLFWPTGGEETFTFGADCITAPLAPYRSSLIFPKGLARARPPRSGPHEGPMASLWTGSSVGADGFPKSPSIDQIIATKLPRETTFASLEASVRHDEKEGANQGIATKHMCYSVTNQPVPPEPDPYAMFDRLMLGAPPGATPPPGGMTTADLEKVRAQRKSVVDLVRTELTVLSSKLGSAERARIDGHVTALRDLERQLEASTAPAGDGGGTPTRGCSAPALDPAYRAMVQSNDAFPAVLKLQTDVMVAALACDRTRVASIQWSRTFSMLQHKWVGVTDPHHTQSHKTDPAALDGQARVSNWYARQLAYLLGQLASVKEGNGTLLDNCLVVWGYDMADGAVHETNPGVAVLAGKLGGRMRTGANGRLVELPGNDWSQLLVTIAHAMGLTQVTNVGDLGKTGPIPGLLND